MLVLFRFPDSIAYIYKQLGTEVDEKDQVHTRARHDELIDRLHVFWVGEHRVLLREVQKCNTPCNQSAQAQESAHPLPQAWTTHTNTRRRSSEQSLQRKGCLNTYMERGTAGGHGWDSHHRSLLAARPSGACVGDPPCSPPHSVAAVAAAVIPAHHAVVSPRVQ